MRRKIAFLVTLFSEISETFILDEILDLQRRGLDVEIVSLFGAKKRKNRRAIKHFPGRVHYARLKSRAFWSAQFYWLSHHPSVYVRLWLKSIGGNLHSFKLFLRALFIVPAAAWVALVLKDRKIDRVHAYLASDAALAAYVIRFLTGIPYSITVGVGNIYERRAMLKEKLSAADFVVAFSDYTSGVLGLYGPEISRKIHVIHPGIVPDHVCRARKMTGNHTVPFTILCVASLKDYKGHRYLVDACASLKEHGLQFQCLIAGEGGERKKLEAQIARRGLRQEIRLLGWQNREEIHNLMKEADVFALPGVVSRDEKQEEFALPLMEAMAMEIPVVATSIFGVSELVAHGQSGLLVPQRNAAALAAAIYLIYSQPASAQEMANEGRSKVLNEFNLHMNAGLLYRLLSGMKQRQPIFGIQVNLEFWEKEKGRAC